MRAAILCLVAAVAQGSVVPVSPPEPPPKPLCSMATADCGLCRRTLERMRNSTFTHPDQLVPKCDGYGNFEQSQSGQISNVSDYSYYQNSWCVHPFSGAEIPNTRTVAWQTPVQCGWKEWSSDREEPSPDPTWELLQFAGWTPPHLEPWPPLQCSIYVSEVVPFDELPVRHSERKRGAPVMWCSFTEGDMCFRYPCPDPGETSTVSPEPPQQNVSTASPPEPPQQNVSTASPPEPPPKPVFPVSTADCGICRGTLERMRNSSFTYSGQFVPKCDGRGNFEQNQYGQISNMSELLTASSRRLRNHTEHWCVHPFSGAEIPNTRTKAGQRPVQCGWRQWSSDWMEPTPDPTWVRVPFTGWSPPSQDAWPPLQCFIYVSEVVPFDELPVRHCKHRRGEPVLWCTFISGDMCFRYPCPYQGEGASPPGPPQDQNVSAVSPPGPPQDQNVSAVSEI